MVSVVIPSRNAPASLTITLAGLAQQTVAAGCYEVIVAGGVDEETIRRRVPLDLPYALRVLVKPGPGASRRRNAGAEVARAELLLFLDDDMEPEPGLLEAHLHAHAGGSGRRVVMGYLPPATDLRGENGRLDWLKLQLRDWWEEDFAAMAQPGHRFAYTDVLSGNFSLPAALFREVGGFDVDYYPCRDDFELGVRLLMAGADLAMCPAARSWHHDKTDLPRLLQRKTDEGRTDVQLARQYPHLRPALLISRHLQALNLASRLLRRVARTSPPAADFLAGLLIPFVRLSERLRMRETWRRLVGGLLVHAYWQGVLKATRDWDDVRSLTAAPALSLALVDLAGGLESVAETLDCCPVQGVRLTWRGLPLGRIEPQAGAEPVRGRHVEAWLRDGGAVALMRAEALDKLLGIDKSAAGWEGDGDAWFAYPDLCTCTPAGAATPAGPAAQIRPAVVWPVVVWEVDLAQGVDALRPLLAHFSQQVLVRQGGQTLGWLYLAESAQQRTIGAVIYTLLAQLDHAAFFVPT